MDGPVQSLIAQSTVTVSAKSSSSGNSSTGGGDIDVLELAFELPAGAYATVVVRELAR